MTVKISEAEVRTTLLKLDEKKAVGPGKSLPASPVCQRIGTRLSILSVLRIQHVAKSLEN